MKGSKTNKPAAPKQAKKVKVADLHPGRRGDIKGGGYDFHKNVKL